MRASALYLCDADGDRRLGLFAERFGRVFIHTDDLRRIDDFQTVPAKSRVLLVRALNRLQFSVNPLFDSHQLNARVVHVGILVQVDRHAANDLGRGEIPPHGIHSDHNGLFCRNRPTRPNGGAVGGRVDHRHTIRFRQRILVSSTRRQVKVSTGGQLVHRIHSAVSPRYAASATWVLGVNHWRPL